MSRTPRDARSSRKRTTAATASLTVESPGRARCVRKLTPGSIEEPSSGSRQRFIARVAEREELCRLHDRAKGARRDAVVLQGLLVVTQVRRCWEPRENSQRVRSLAARRLDGNLHERRGGHNQQKRGNHQQSGGEHVDQNWK